MGVSHSLLKQPYNTIAYRILLALLWTQFTVLKLVKAVVGMLPYIGDLAEIFIPACIVIATMAAMPWFLKRIRGSDIIFYTSMVFLVLFTLVLFPDNREYLEEEWWRTLIAAAPIYFIGVSFSIETCSRDLFWCSVVGVVFVLLYRIYLLSSGVLLESDDMDAAYKLLPSVMYLIYYASIKNKKLYWMIAAFATMVLFIFGTRGPIICVAAFLIALVILKIIKSEKSAKKLLLSAAVIVFIILLFDEDIFYAIIRKSAALFGRIGFSTRIFDYFLAGNITESQGRRIFIEKITNAIIESPIIGYGFTGDRPLLGIYTHNMFFEIWCHFGIILGTLILCALTVLTILAFIKSWRKETVLEFVVMLCCMVFVKLMLSGSYSTEATFYFMLGVFVAILRKRNIRSRNH